MSDRLALIWVLAMAAAPAALAGPDCSRRTPPAALPISATSLPPLSTDLPLAEHRLGMGDPVLGRAADEAQAVDIVLARLRADACRPPAAGTTASGYVPRTKWDNTPYRFNAGGNGKKFSAADFDAWMKANGIHVAKGVPQPVQPTAQEGASTPSAPASTPTP